jgi:hypothetical protein
MYLFFLILKNFLVYIQLNIRIRRLWHQPLTANNATNHHTYTPNRHTYETQPHLTKTKFIFEKRVEYRPFRPPKGKPGPNTSFTVHVGIWPFCFGFPFRDGRGGCLNLPFKSVTYETNLYPRP